MFRIGQKVVCVNAERARLRGVSPALIGAEAHLVVGATYHIRAVDLTHPNDPELLPCVLLEEFKNGHQDAPVWAHRFRPIVEKKTDTGMAILREILERETINDRAPART